MNRDPRPQPLRSASSILAALIFCLALLPVRNATAADEPRPEIPFAVRIEIGPGKSDLDRLYGMRINLDGAFEGWARAYVTQGEYDKLARLGYRLSVLPDEGKIGLARMATEGVAANVGREVAAAYHTYETLTSDLQTIAADHANIARLTSIGQSIQGRELWMMKISGDPDLEQDEPEFAYISSMHGDEVTGKELCFNLINHLTDNYGSDPRVTALVDGAEIWIMPSMNPDGTALGQRGNANGIDLNRHFPDQFDDPVNTTVGREPEAVAVMNWTLTRNIDLSLNYHGGALLVNYPFDSNPAGSSTFSPTPEPDQPMILSMSRTYTDNNPPMYANTSGSIVNGVTNGAAWYSINGGMQDWRYVWHGGFEVLVEVSNSKWPPASELPQFWDDNRESMLSYLERGFEGVRGLVSDAVTGAPVAAEIRLEANPFPSYTDPEVGDYHRLVLPGSYTMEVSALGYATQTIPVTIAAGAAIRYDVALQPLDTELEFVSSIVDDGAGGDGVLDPGEPADLAVTLRNLGLAATGVQATLESTGWYAQVSREGATFPDIATGLSAESDAPHFAIVPAVSIPAGHRLGFAVRWKTDSAQGSSEPFFLDVGEATCVEQPASDVPQAIDEALPTTTSQISVVSDKLLSEVRVPVDISHTYIGDLTISITSPLGTSVMLHNRSGGSAEDIVGTYGVDLNPAESLTALTGEAAAGDWTLVVTDHAGGDTGMLNGWSADLCGRPEEAATPEMKFSDAELDAGGMLLRWWPYPGISSYRVYRSTDPASAAAFIDVSAEDGDVTDTSFLDNSTDSLSFFLVTGVGAQGEGTKGHFGE